MATLFTLLHMKMKAFPTHTYWSVCLLFKMGCPVLVLSACILLISACLIMFSQSMYWFCSQKYWDSIRRKCQHVCDPVWRESISPKGKFDLCLLRLAKKMYCCCSLTFNLKNESSGVLKKSELKVDVWSLRVKFYSHAVLPEWATGTDWMYFLSQADQKLRCQMWVVLIYFICGMFALLLWPFWSTIHPLTCMSALFLWGVEQICV